MIATKALLKASWHASTGMLRTRNSHSLKEAAMPSTPLMVPIRSLGPSSRERITAHLLKLEPADRYLRFGYAANDEQIPAMQSSSTSAATKSSASTTAAWS